MKKKQLDSLKIYDWAQTVVDEKNQDRIIPRNFSTTFHQEVKEPSMHAKVSGNWGAWKLTDEGSGQYPVFKCYIENGIFEVDINHKRTTYDLQNTWIKICLKIQDSQAETYSISEKEDTLYSINHSFRFSKGKDIMSTLVDKLLVTWFKKNRALLKQQLNTYTIHSRTSNDLTLMGWDTNYVTSFSNVNKTIQQQKLFPSTFKQTIIDEGLGVEFSMNGTFNSWEIATGADGQNVNFICKFGENSKIYNKNANKTYKFASDSYIKIQLKLKYFNEKGKTFEDPTGLGDGYQVNLKVKDENENGDPAVIIINKHISDELTGLMGDIVTSMIKKWLNENIDEFGQIFSHFLLNETAKDKNFQWLKPTDVYYGVAEAKDEEGKPSLDKSVFAVMTMVEDHKNESPTHTVDGRLLHAVKNEKDTNDSAFGIDMPLFVEKWIKQALIAMQIGTLDQFETTDNGKVIKNKEKIQFGTFPNTHDKNVPAYIDKGKLSFGVINNQLVLDIVDLYWEQARGMNGHVNFRQSFDISLKSGVDELGKPYKNVLIPTEDGEATLLLTYTVEEWKQKENLIIEICTGIALGIITGYVGGKLFDKAAKFIKKAFQKSGNKMYAYIPLQNMSKEIGAGKLAPEVQKKVYNQTTQEIGQGFSKEAIKQVNKLPRPMYERILMTTPKVIGGIVVGSVGGVIPTAIIGAIENSQKKYYSELPTINAFVANSVGAVQWPDNSEFHVETAKLQGIYLMGGQLNKSKL